MEYFDVPERAANELSSHYEWLNRINRITRFERPFRTWIPRLLPGTACRSLEILDVGAGDGALGRTLAVWAKARGWDWRFTDLDASPQAQVRNQNPRTVLGSACELPFATGSFDLVIANNMTHHLSPEEAVVRHFREASRVARRLVLICDMHRNPGFLLVLGTLLVACRAPPAFRRDGLLSVRRGWRVAEWRRLAGMAALPEARVWAEHGSRILLADQK